MSATRLLVLGVVRMHGRAHGYLVGCELVSWGAEEWANVKWGSIYHALKQAASEGLLRAIKVEKWPGRTDYELTTRGEAEFLRLLRDALRLPYHHPDTIGAGLVLLPALSRNEAIALLRERLGVLEAERDDVAMLLEPGAGGRPAHARELFGLWDSLISSGAAWTRGLIERLEGGAYVMAGEGDHSVGSPDAESAPTPPGKKRKSPIELNLRVQFNLD
ncbi:MAG: PadR family transcriptional regulator [Dehalococcoidia bacterium]